MQDGPKPQRFASPANPSARFRQSRTGTIEYDGSQLGREEVVG